MISSSVTHWFQKRGALSRAPMPTNPSSPMAMLRRGAACLSFAYLPGPVTPDPSGNPILARSVVGALLNVCPRGALPFFGVCLVGGAAGGIRTARPPLS